MNCSTLGHTKAVWTIISMDDHRSGSKIIITGAADNLIMAWKDQRNIRTYEGKMYSCCFLIRNEFSSFLH